MHMSRQTTPPMYPRQSNTDDDEKSNQGLFCDQPPYRQEIWHLEALSLRLRPCLQIERLSTDCMSLVPVPRQAPAVEGCRGRRVGVCIEEGLLTECNRSPARLGEGVPRHRLRSRKELQATECGHHHSCHSVPLTLVCTPY